jgi:2-polyprenyl-6-hydroxyphenyl methylase/3-demethylubiquinone-9 3-methyltransferase
MTAPGGATIAPANVALFSQLAADWWDPNGSSRLLHRINPARLAYVHRVATAHFGRDPHARRALAGLSALDAGCGGGLVTEPLARMGADVSGLDAGAEVIAVARAHAAAQGLAIDYVCGEIGALLDSGRRFDLITCLEVVEHVTDRSRFINNLFGLLRPGGLLLFSTPNRTIASYAVLILGAERIARAVPEGGHDWHRFATPAELTAELEAAGFVVGPIEGFGWSPRRGFRVGGSGRIDYIGSAVRP